MYKYLYISFYKYIISYEILRFSITKYGAFIARISGFHIVVIFIKIALHCNIYIVPKCVEYLLALNREKQGACNKRQNMFQAN